MDQEKKSLLERSKSMTYRRIDQPKLSNKISKSVTYSFYPPIEIVEDEGPVAEGGSVLLMIFINFLSNVVFSIVLPSLPNFLKSVGGQPYLNGWAVAVNSLGTFIASPLFGFWADRRTYREVMTVSLIVMLASNLWYALCKDMYQLFGARFLVGIAAANYAPANSYLSYATSTSERVKVMAWNASASVLGFICGPSFALITAIPALNFQIHIGSYLLVFNAETAPGWISCILSVIGIFCLFSFKEIPKRGPAIDPKTGTSVNPRLDEMKQASMRSIRSLKMINKTAVPLRGVLVCLFLSFSYTSAFTIFETIGPIYVADDIYTNFDIFYTSLLFLGISMLSLFSLMSLQGLLLVVSDDRKLMVLYGCILVTGLGIFVQLGEERWITIPRFFTAVSLVSIGYAVGQALLLALFSKLLDEQEQGVMMGWLSSAAAISRMTVPVCASYAYVHLNPNYIFLFTAVLVFISVLFIIIFWQYLDPHRTKAQPPTKVESISRNV